MRKIPDRKKVFHVFGFLILCTLLISSTSVLGLSTTTVYAHEKSAFEVTLADLDDCFGFLGGQKCLAITFDQSATFSQRVRDAFSSSDHLKSRLDTRPRAKGERIFYDRYIRYESAVQGRCYPDACVNPDKKILRGKFDPSQDTIEIVRNSAVTQVVIEGSGLAKDLYFTLLESESLAVIKNNQSVTIQSFAGDPNQFVCEGLVQGSQFRCELSLSTD